MRNKSEFAAYVLTLLKQQGKNKKQLGDFLSQNTPSQNPVQKVNNFLKEDSPRLNLNYLQLTADFFQKSPFDLLFKKREVVNSDQLLRFNRKFVVPLFSEKDIESSWKNNEYEELLHVPLMKDMSSCFAIKIEQERTDLHLKKGSVLIFDARLHRFSLHEKIILLQHQANTVKKTYIGKYRLDNEDQITIETEKTFHSLPFDEIDVLGTLIYVIQQY